MGQTYTQRRFDLANARQGVGSAASSQRPRKPHQGVENLSLQSLLERDPGQSIPADLRRYLADRFGADLDHVRLHDNALAAAQARDVEARAFTFDNHVVFDQAGFQPRQMAGVSLLAHEISHVIQQSQSQPGQTADHFVGDEAAADRTAIDLTGSQRLSVGPSSPLGIARQTQPTVVPVLTPEEMFRLVQTERAWTYNPGGMVCEDPRGVGRGVGPAAGGRRAGYSVFAVIQITDRQGQAVALTYGEHLRYGAPHAEQGAVNALNRSVPPGVDLKGGRMTVVLDQVPCPPGRQDCLGLLQRYASRKGLELDIRLPTRQAMRGSRTVAPRTAAMSAQRTDVPAVTLYRYLPPGARGGTTPGAAGPTVVPSSGSSAVAALPVVSQPRPASPSMVKQRVALVSQLQRQTQRSIAFTTRVRIYSGVFSGLMSLLSFASVTSDAMSLLAEGTVLSGAQKQANKIEGQSRDAHQWVLDSGADINLLGYIAIVHDAIQREDDDTLFDIDQAASDLGIKLGDFALTFGDMAKKLKARSQAMDVMADFYKKLAQIPQGTGTAANAQAFAMYVSLERLSGTVNSAAENYKKAAEMLAAYDKWLNDLAYRANREAWSIIGRRIVSAMQEIEKREAAKRERGERVDRYLQKQRILHRIATLEELAEQPQCLDPTVLESMRQQRDALVEQLRLLESGFYVPSETSPQ
ncbi:MAG: DUF4157 domain-containing protein [Candidatus Thiodiazotropha sp.]